MFENIIPTHNPFFWIFGIPTMIGLSYFVWSMIHFDTKSEFHKKLSGFLPFVVIILTVGGLAIYSSNTLLTHLFGDDFVYRISEKSTFEIVLAYFEIGLSEEFWKISAGLLLFTIFNRKSFQKFVSKDESVKYDFFTFALLGAFAFAIVENGLYAFSSHSIIDGNVVFLAKDVTGSIVSRTLFSIPVHLSCTAIFAYCFLLSHRFGKLRFIAYGLALSSSLHALFNVSVTIGLTFVMMSLTVFFFIFGIKTFLEFVVDSKRKRVVS